MLILITKSTKNIMSLANKINNLVISEMKKFIVLYSDEVEEVNAVEFISKLEEFLDRHDSTLSKESVSKSRAPAKEKVKRQAKEYPDEERCTALKLDGERCKGKRTAGDYPELCQLHTNGKKGKMTSIKEDPNEGNTTGLCQYVATKGKTKGEVCNKLMPCKKHMPKEPLSEAPVTKRVAKKPQEFSDDEPAEVKPKIPASVKRAAAKIAPSGKVKSKPTISTETDEENDYADEVYSQEVMDDVSEEDEEIYD